MDPQELKILRNEYLRLTICRNVKDCFDAINIYADYFLQTIQNHQLEPVQTAAEGDAKIINQMMLTKLLHIEQLIQGISFTDSTGTVLNQIVDPTVVASQVRNVYETIGMFNLIYRYANTDEEKLIISNLWVIAGLNYRQKFMNPDMPSHLQQKAVEEKQTIEDLIVQIEATSLYQGLDEKNKGKIQTRIKEKDYRIKFENNNVSFLNWHELAGTLGVKEGLFDHMYTYFSMYSHPSYVSVFQFGQMFGKDERDFVGITIHNIKYLFMLLGSFISDYIYLFPNVKGTFEKLPLINQLIINGQNMLLRGKDYSINDSWKELN